MNCLIWILFSFVYKGLISMPSNVLVINCSNGLPFNDFTAASSHCLSLILSKVVVFIFVINIITPIELIISFYLKRFHDILPIYTRKTLTINRFINEFLHVTCFLIHFII